MTDMRVWINVIIFFDLTRTRKKKKQRAIIRKIIISWSKVTTDITYEQITRFEKEIVFLNILYTNRSLSPVNIETFFFIERFWREIHIDLDLMNLDFEPNRLSNIEHIRNYNRYFQIKTSQQRFNIKIEEIWTQITRTSIW